MGSVHRRLRGAAAAFRAVWARTRPERESGGIAPCFADFGGPSQRSCATTRGLVTHAVANHHRKPLTCGLDAFRGLQENGSTRAVSTDAITTSLRVTDAVLEKLRSMKDRHAQICELLLQPDLAPRDMASLGKELSGLETVVQLHGELEELQQELNNLTEMERDSGEDAEIREMASSERRDTEAQLTEMEGRIVVELLPKDKDDGKDVILEVRAGTGGDEAGLFAADLFAMYKKHAGIQGWRFEDLDVTKVGDGNSSGIKSASASLSGDSIYSHLKFENGVHRVQRVPTTDTQGRIHTSTATVVVMPEADEVDVNLSESDIRVDVFRASGAGGQHVNTTESAVRMTHIPTGITVSMQDERSQHRNRAKALTVLRARVYDAERRKAQEALQERRSTAGTGDRGERIRTYNFKEGRITDHRVGLTEHGIDEMLAGELLTRFTQALQVQERMDLMETMEGESS